MKKIKKIISIGLCALTLSTSASLPAFAARSADPNNLQIVNKVEQFNNCELATLRTYIWKTNYQFVKDDKVNLLRDLIALYRRLDKLVVSNIKAANELCPSLDVYDPGSIKVNLDILLTSLNNIDVSGIKQHYGFSAFLADSFNISEKPEP